MRSLSTLASFVLVLVLAACSPDLAAPADPPDAAPEPVVLDPSGRHAVTSTYALAAPPPELAPFLAEVALATDGVTDPTAYLVDLVVAELPEGSARSVAIVLAPYVAAELHGRIATYAPELAPALRELALGATRIATRFSTIEDVIVTADARAGHVIQARARRAIRGVRVDNTEIPFASIGVGDTSADAELTVELVGVTGEPSTLVNRVVVAKHAVPVPIGAWFRPAFDRAVIPTVVPGATDLAAALRALVDCPRLGAAIAEAVGFGAPALYAHACTIGLGVAAAKIYARFPAAAAAPEALELAGTARATDRDGDGAIDAIEAGAWTGTLGEVSVGASVFDGVRHDPR